VPATAELRFRAACPGDTQPIAALHADSWQRHYRGAFTGAFLDHDAAGYLLQLWTARLGTPDPQARTILAERDGAVVGLAHTLLGQDTTWGAFLDKIHVTHELKRQKIGTRLLALTAQAVLDTSPASGLYLWVLEQNSDARAFYTARGGVCVQAQRQADHPDIRMARPIPATFNSPITVLCNWRRASNRPQPHDGQRLARVQVPRELDDQLSHRGSADEPVRHAPQRCGAHPNHRPERRVRARPSRPAPIT
jgi:GNAT superfamily N-acetyltransferase